ncbi:Hypothetical protein IALB_0668 [Ignavibacterium album JCM 16511]|uniref:Uncharacterized protein n=1 Tax=Ignavibacterium album (strain DSM 19864 / JCM 16511 / NBRC 101810 / Mat9-16) TaxID=945713 RepID=I0AHC3_IGNAJ|nr:hypothetical protein [Ignavibacterium album]AFH48380.1 Hypothetical protein IALB_0668 [Ignavibacterium album JCM 16511]
MNKTSFKKVLTFSIFLFLLSLNIRLSITDGGLDLFVPKLKVEQNKALAAPEQNFRMSMGYGCICGQQRGNYWASCHLPGSECSIFECTCFSYN